MNLDQLPLKLNKSETVIWDARMTSIYLYRFLILHACLSGFFAYCAAFSWDLPIAVGNSEHHTYVMLLIFLFTAILFWIAIYLFQYKFIHRKILYILTNQRLVILKTFPFTVSEDIFLDRVESVHKAPAFGFGRAVEIKIEEKSILLNYSDAETLYNHIMADKIRY